VRQNRFAFSWMISAWLSIFVVSGEAEDARSGTFAHSRLLTGMLLFFHLMLFSTGSSAFGLFPNDREWLAVHSIVEKDDAARGLLQRHMASVGASMDSANANPIQPRDFNQAQMLAYAWRFTGDRRYLEKLKPALLSWAVTDQPTGNPLNDERIGSAAIAIQQVRGDLTEWERQQVDAWMLRYVNAMQKWAAKQTRVDNWMDWALRNAGFAAIAANDKSSAQWVSNKAKEVMARGLFGDGSTADFIGRDAIGYHLYGLGALLELAQALKTADVADLYGWQTSEGGSLPKSLAFVEPYITGEKTHIEFVHTKYPPDITTIHKDEAGKPWRAKQGGRIYGFIAADSFDPRWGDWDRKLNNTSPYPHGMLDYLLNQATREAN